MISPGSSVTLQALLYVPSSLFFCHQTQLTTKTRGDIAELRKLHVGENCLFCPYFLSEPINQSASWTSVSECIMDDIAEGPARQRGWVPGRDNEPAFSQERKREVLLYLI